MNKTLCLIALGFTLMVAGCNAQRYKKADDGSEYKIISNAKGKKAVEGNFLELNILVKYKDSVLFSTAENGMPNFIPFDTMTLPKFFKEVHEGDSLIIRQATDSIIALGQNPPWMEKGNYIIQSIKVSKVYPTKEAADSVSKTFEGTARAKQYDKTIKAIEKDLGDKSAQMKTDEEIIKNYLTENNLQAQKTKWGTYVVITSPGSGPTLTKQDVAVVNYTGRTFKDSTFDSNTNPKFGHPQPLYVDMSQFQVIPGWVDGLKLMRKGTKGKMIIPSYLAYKGRGMPPRIAPNANLIFDMEVTDVVNQQQYQVEMQKEQEQMMQQRQMMEQMQKMQQQQQHQQQTPTVPPPGK